MKYRNRKILRVMRWNIVLILVSVLQVAAIGVAAQEKVSLNLKDVSAEQVFREIKRQTKYDFVYNRFGLLDFFYYRVLKQFHHNGAKILI